MCLCRCSEQWLPEGVCGGQACATAGRNHSAPRCCGQWVDVMSHAVHKTLTGCPLFRAAPVRLLRPGPPPTHGCEGRSRALHCLCLGARRQPCRTRGVHARCTPSSLTWSRTAYVLAVPYSGVHLAHRYYEMQWSASHYFTCACNAELPGICEAVLPCWLRGSRSTLVDLCGFVLMLICWAGARSRDAQ